MKRITFYFTFLFLFAFSWQGITQMTENFDGGTFPPIDWSITTGEADWQLYDGFDHTSGTTSSALYNCYNIEVGDAAPAYLTSPRMHVTSSDKIFSFWTNYFFVEGEYGNTASLSIDVSADGGENWTSGTTNYIAGQHGAGWFQTSVDLTTFEGLDFSGEITRVRFRAVSDYGSYNIAIDDVVGPVEYVPTCPYPTDLSAQIDNTGNSVTLTWSRGDSEDSWYLEFGDTGFTQGTGTTLEVFTNPTLDITNLTYGNTYDFYVQSNCDGSGLSDWSGPYTWVQLFPPGCSSNPTPLDNQVNVLIDEGDVYISWDAPTTGGPVVYYEFWFGTTPGDLTSLGYTDDTNGYLILDYATTYYWMLVPTNGGGGATGCPVWSFTTEDAPPIPGCSSNPTPYEAQVNVVFEANGYVYTSWDAPTTGGPVGYYEIWLGTTPGDLTNLGSSEDTNAYLILDYATTYYWMIVPTNGGGGATGCSVWSFTTEDAPPPPDNDTCATATILTPGASFSDNSIETSNIGATASGETPDPTCSNFGDGQDVWFSVVVPASGSITMETNTNGGLTDTGMSVYSGSCGALTEVDCDDDSSTDSNMSMIILTGRTPGEVLLVRVFEYGNNSFGSFLISAYDVSLSIADATINGFNMFPNPVTNTLNLNAQEQIDAISIYNMLGQEVLRNAPSTTQVQLDMSNLPTGSYIVKVQAGEQLGTYNLIKQ